MTIRFSLATTAAAALLALALPAAAAPFTVESNGPNIGVGATYHAPVGSDGTTAGAFNVTSDAFGGAFTAWCLDLAHKLGLPSEYELTSSPFVGNPISAGVQSTVKALFDTAYSTLNLGDADQSAGFQMALWEILTEGESPVPYSVDAGAGQGSFWITGTGTANARNIANGFLGGLGGPTNGDYTLTFLQSTDGKQSLITVDTPVSPVPLPAAGVLLFGALGGLGVVARRRKSAEA